MNELSKEKLISRGHHSPGVGVLVCIPTLGRALCMDWANAYKSLHPPINYNMNILIIPNKPVAEARQQAVECALEHNHKFIFFLGDDTIPPGDVLKRFIARMEFDPNLGVVGGVYCAKSDPPYPLVFQEWGAGSDWNWKIGEFFKVKGMGMDCTLIRTAMLRDMKQPVFKTIDEDQFIDGINKAESWTEDLWFCDQVEKQTDYDKYIDASVLCGHYDSVNNMIVVLPPDCPPIINRVESEGLKFGLDIGAGGNPQRISGYKMVTYDKNEDAKPDYRGDVRVLPFDTKHFDLVYSSHTLEHIPKAEAATVLNEWVRVIKDDGLFCLKLPDIGWAMDKIQAGEIDKHVMNVLYGGQEDGLDFHFNGFTLEILEKMLLLHFRQVMVKKRDLYNLFAICSNDENDIDFGAVERMVLGD